jgi:hypothetical protein
MEFEHVVIPKNKMARCLELINRMHHPMVMKGSLLSDQKRLASGGRWAEGKQQEVWYSWVTNPPKGGWTSLEDAFNEWRYETAVCGHGEFVVTNFIGEKWGDDEQLWEEIKSCVKDGSAINFTGEDDSRWRYEFKDGERTELSGSTVWT